MFYMIALCLFPVTGIVIFLYLRSTLQLFENVKENVPELWVQLGRPKRIFVQGMHTIQPIIHENKVIRRLHRFTQI